MFYPKFAAECARKAWNYWRGIRHAKALLQRIVSDPERYGIALAPGGRLRAGGAMVRLGGCDQPVLAAGEAVIVRTPTGGGFGPPSH